MDSSARQAVRSPWGLAWLAISILLIAILIILGRPSTPKHEIRVFGEAHLPEGMGLYRGDAEDAFRDFADPNLKPGLVRYFWGYPDENVAYILPLGGGSSAGSPFLNGDRALEEAEFLLKTEWDFLNGAAGRHYSGMDIHTRDNRRILIVFDGAAVTMAMSPDSSDPLDYWLKDAGDESQRLERFFRSYFDLWKQLSLYGTPAPSWI